MWNGSDSGNGDSDDDGGKVGGVLPPCDPVEGRLRLSYCRTSAPMTALLVSVNPGANGP